MGLFKRNQTDLDGAAVARAHGERSLASLRALDRTVLVATDRALHVGELRFPWDRVAKATWDDEDAALTVVGATGAGEKSLTLRIEVGDPTARLLEVVRTMVTSSVVVSQRIESAVYGGAWVTARRDPDSTDLRWTVVFDPGRDPRDPQLRAWADENVAQIRRSTGV